MFGYKNNGSLFRDPLKNDVFIRTSRFEGLPLGILEALSLGLPCLVTKGTNLDELVNNYNAGWGVETTSKMVASAIKNAVLKEHSLIEYINSFYVPLL